MCPYEIEIDDTPSEPGSDGPGAVDLVPLESLSEAQLDELPYGVICVHREGTILRYNLAEARLARLDRALVRGKNFFTQVAPCTARPEFQGRIEAFLANPGGAPSERFPYLFDFSFGAQLVTVELMRSQWPDRVYLLINRRQILPVRADAFRPAPALAAWEGEAPAGVRRDERAQRYVQMPGAALGRLLAAAQRLGVDADVLLTEWGVEWGRRAGIELEAWALETYDTPLRQLPIGQALALVASRFAEQGWGTLTADFAPAPQSGAFVIRIDRSIWQESLRLGALHQHCFSEGFLRALLARLASRKLSVQVVASALDGENAGSSADFLVVAEERAGALRQAIEGGGSTADILQQLGKALP
ncbi:MAG: hypothetical protein EOO75_17185 [Myxococcales bacterium]|nr:MAG: hypothetical protein EOO75_17185 [Myxococcales bacterium]